MRRIPRGDVRNHGVPGAGDAVVAEVGRLHEGRGGYAAEGDGQKEGGPHCQNEAAVPRAGRRARPRHQEVGENLEGLGGVCLVRLQQIPLDVLRVGGLPDRLLEGQLPC